jgi:hypothetical protein
MDILNKSGKLIYSVPGKNLWGADLRGAYLRGADLWKANLWGADLRGANLEGADLQEADLQEADLWGADLQGANLRKADLRGADLRGADLRGADLRGADLRGADLRGADLRGADLWEADLRGANLQGANLQGANLQGAKGLGELVRCPAGEITGYKKAGKYIVVLTIPAEAKRVNCIGSNKCRCDTAKVVAISNLDGSKAEGVACVASSHDSKFLYELGQVVTAPDYNPSDRVECSGGIHFFMTRQEAEEY